MSIEWCIYKGRKTTITDEWKERLIKGQTWVFAHLPILSFHIIIKASTKQHWFFFCSLIFNPWETFFPPQQIKEGWVGRQGPDQLSQAAISTVLSVWHTRKIWALSKAEGAISQPSELFSSILLYYYLPLLIFFSPAIIPLPCFTLSFPSSIPLFSQPLIRLHTTT